MFENMDMSPTSMIFPHYSTIDTLAIEIKYGIHFSPLDNYMCRVGNTYFTRKIIAKIRLIITIINELKNLASDNIYNLDNIPENDFLKAIK